MPDIRSVPEAILDQLSLWGVKRIYGVAGDAIFGLLDAISRQNAIQFIQVKHESVAALMAAAEAKCTGNVGVCVSQMGPGLANLVNGLGDAYLDGSPVLAITGQAPLIQMGTTYKQYINQQALVQAISGYTELIVHPDAVIPSLSNALHKCTVMQTVSHLSIPADLFAMTTHIRTREPIRRTEGMPHPDKIQQALEIMRLAKRPMILAGSRSQQARKEIEQLAGAWGCGIATDYGAVGVIPDACPLGLGGLGEGGNPFLSDRFKEADSVLVLGSSWWPKGDTPTNAQVVQVESNHLKLGIGVPAECGLAGDIAQIATQLTQGLKSHLVNPDWLQQILQCKKTWSCQNESEGNESSFPLYPSRIIRTIEKCVSPNAIIALDEGDSTLWFMRNFRIKHQQVLMSSQWRTMGFGLPAAMAAKCNFPEQQVLCLTGDGGLAMVLADLLTAVRYQLNITLIVVNNGTLQMERNKMTEKGLRPVGTEITNPDYAMLAKACGWQAHRVNSPDEFEYLLASALTSPKPVLLDVPTAHVLYPDYSNT